VNSNQQGVAAEHLVIAQLNQQGFSAFLAGCGLRYDVVVDINGRLLRVQVKSTLKQIYEHGHKHPTYKFNLAKGERSKPISADEVDVVALVACDSGDIAYLPAKRCSAATIKIRPAGSQDNNWSKRRNKIDQLSFKKCLEELEA